MKSSFVGKTIFCPTSKPLIFFSVKASSLRLKIPMTICSVVMSAILFSRAILYIVSAGLTIIDLEGALRDLLLSISLVLFLTSFSGKAFGLSAISLISFFSMTGTGFVLSTAIIFSC